MTPMMQMLMNRTLTREMVQKFEEEVERTRMKTVVTRTVDGQERHFLVSTCNTFDHGWETMVFACKEDGEVSDWGDLYADRYGSQEEAAAGHQNTVETWQYDPAAEAIWGYDDEPEASDETP